MNHPNVTEKPVVIDQPIEGPIELTDPVVVPLEKPAKALGFGLNSNDVKLIDYLANQAQKKSSNLFMSTMSVDMALGMLYCGANGSSYEELKTYLGLTDEEMKKAAKLLIEAAKASENGRKDRPNTFVSIANSLWYKEDQVISEDYIGLLKEYFGADVQTADFHGDAADKINAWAAEKTRNLIKGIVNKEVVEKASDVLVNAIYFKGPWIDEFYKTEQDDFTLTDGSKVKCDMMSGTGFEYYENDQAVGFSKLYAGGYKFVGILPKETGDFSLESLDVVGLLENGTMDFDVDVRMPKLEVSYSDEGELMRGLKELGVNVIFSDAADFSNISRGLTVSNILHKAVLKLDEKGTEAAAVTSVIVSTTGLPVQRETKLVELNRPFAFFILDSGNNAFFAGKILNPAK